MGNISAVDLNINGLIWFRGHLFRYDYYEKYASTLNFVSDSLMPNDCEPADGIPRSGWILWVPVSSKKKFDLFNELISDCSGYLNWRMYVLNVVELPCLIAYWLAMTMVHVWAIVFGWRLSALTVSLILYQTYLMRHNITYIFRLSLRVQLSGGMYWLR